MFSGIIKEVGQIVEVAEVSGDRRLTIGFKPAALGPLDIGGSVAVNGVCLTATACDEDRFTADVSAETSAVTTFRRLAAGARVNLEPAMRLGDSLDGHLVTGHIDGVGEVAAMAPAGGSTQLTIELPAELRRYVARKGSIAIDGVSLTVNAVRGRTFDVNIIPHTRSATIIDEYRLGSTVNIEVDIIARYLERLGQRDGADPGITLEFLRKHGYASND